MRSLKVLKNASMRGLALASCSLAALLATPAAAQTTPANGAVTPRYGNLSPFYGNLSPFYGNLSPFYGNLSPFYGNLSPFWGNLSPFYGNLSPFYGNLSPFIATTDPTLTALYGSTDPFWGGDTANPYTHNPSKYVTYSKISGFWTTEAASWMSIQKAWAAAKTSNDYQNIANMIQNNILNPAGNFWGSAVTKATKAQDFATGYSNDALTDAGIKLNGNTIDPNSLANLTPTQQAMFFLNFYDGLMAYSGTGHVDWWMGATGWSPNLASVVGTIYKSDSPVTVGMIDFSVTPNGSSTKGSLSQYGSTVFSNGHGAAVGSLIMGSVDGSGIMGIMPAGAANVIVYNPYDSTGTTNWTDVGTGIDVLTNSIFGSRKSGAPVGVINASLGVPGWTLNPGWNDALSSGSGYGHNLVVAAGNEGVQQKANVAWNFARNPNLIVVGSVGLDGTISNFSNTPGEACLISTGTGACDKLKNHFIVAPGELILVSDGNGGFSRQTGTSLAAPLVSGAIALLQARWPWLGYYPDETAQIILKSATPKGTNPGADPIYGVGELNIAASQAPLDFKKLVYFQVSTALLGLPVPVPVSQVVTQVKTGSQTAWNTQKLYFTALETIGNTHRDFQIPMASSLVGQLVTTEAGQQQFQSFLSTALRSWVAGGANFAGASAVDRPMLGFMESSTPVGRVGGMDLRLKMSPVATTYGFRTNNLPLNTDFALIGATQSLRFGYGQGAAALAGQTGFAQRSDYQADGGGANPLLGLASGGAYLDWRMGLGDRWSLSVGTTQRRDVRDIAVFGPLIQNSSASVYTASAQHIGVDYAATDRLTLHTAYTRLHEDRGLLGVQSMQAGALQNGSTTSGATFGFDFDLTGNLALSASGTVAKTDAGGVQSLHTGKGGLTSSAGEVALTRSALFSNLDRLRLTVSKPMQVDNGQIEYTDYGVVDRQTGALGLIKQSVGAANSRTPLALEMFYGRLLPKQGAEVSVFMRAGANTTQFGADGRTDYMAGAKYKLAF